MNIKKILSLAISVSLPLTFFQGFNFINSSAEDIINVNIVPEASYFVRTDTNVTKSIRVSAFITGLNGQKVTDCSFKFSSDGAVNFSDLANPTDSGDEKRYSYGNKIISSKYPPYEFGLFSKNSNGTYNFYMPADENILGNDIAKDTYYGSEIYYKGHDENMNSGLEFTVPDYTEDGVNKYSKVYSSDSEDENSRILIKRNTTGGATIRYHFMNHVTDPENGEVIWYDDVNTMELPGYTRTGKSGEAVRDDTKIRMISRSGKEAGNENIPFAQATASFMLNSEAETMKITADPESTYVVTSSGKKYSTSNGNLKINYGEIDLCDKIVCTRFETKPAYYSEEDGNYISAKDNVTKAEIEVTNGDFKKKVDITDKVYISGNNGLWEDATSAWNAYLDGFSYTPMSYSPSYGGTLLRTADGNIITTADVYIGLRGDANLDGAVDAKDASLILQHYAQSLNGNKNFRLVDNDDPYSEGLAYYLADVDTRSRDQGASGGNLDAKDATYILRYYANTVANVDIEWSQLIG